MPVFQDQRRTGKWWAYFRTLAGRRVKRLIRVSEQLDAERIAVHVADTITALRAGAYVRADSIPPLAMDVVVSLIPRNHPLRVARSAHDPLSKHLADHVAGILANNRTGRHARETERLVREVFAACGWKLLSDIDEGQFLALLDTFRRDGRGARTRNAYLVCVRGFCRWCVAHGLLPADPTRNIRRANEQADRRQVHREFTVDEFRRLCVATKRRSRDRWLAYKLMGLAGLRVDEVRRARWCDLALDRGYLRLRRKSQRVVDVRLNAELIGDLREALGRRIVGLADSIVTLPARLNQTFDRDLVAAGLATCEDGKVRKVAEDLSRFTPHSLRQSFGVWLYDAGANIGEVQLAMDHSTASMTDRYLRNMGRVVRDDAVNRLPTVELAAGLVGA